MTSRRKLWPKDGNSSTILYMDGWRERLKKNFTKEEKKRGGIQPLCSKWVADFMMRQDAGIFLLGKYLSDKQIPWRRRGRLGMAVTGITTTVNFLTKTCKIESAECRLCIIAREAQGESTDGLAIETYGHINNSGCKRLATTVTADHHSFARHLYVSLLIKSQTASSSWSRLTKKVIWAHCGNEKSFLKF